jgi:predicted AAA+ superfamily ATPase
VHWNKHPAYLWSVANPHAMETLDALPLHMLRGIEAQKAALCENLKRLAVGAAAHDILLWGARGMGKSALVRAVVGDLQQKGNDIALVQVSAPSFAAIPNLIEVLAEEPRAFLLFLDDLGFNEGDLQGNLALRSLLDGGVLGRPANVRLAVTSNRRAIVQREATTPAELHERDERDNALALADRFGLTLAFHPCEQATYLEIVRSYTDPLGLKIDEKEANGWAIARGNRSGRTAYQFACELAGRAGLSI